MKNILVVATHPDDEVLGCGGVIARHARTGDRVHVIVVTRGMPERFSPAVVEESRRELAAAHAILGVCSVRFLDFPAPCLDVTPGYLIAEAIHSAVAELRPEVVYLPHHGDIHGDHRAVNLAVMVATRPNGAPSVAKLLAYETLSETEWAIPNHAHMFQPTVFADITEYLPDKLKAMECYRSQLKAAPHARSLEAIRALATYRGHTVHLPAAEAFALLREVVV